MNKSFTIQEYLSLGYLYLLILGVISDAIYYQFLHINILHYTTVLDVLLSPIARITSHLLIPLIIVLGTFFTYFLVFKWSPAMHRKYRQSRWYRRIYNVDKLDR